jgi:hypothetical protein
MIWSSVDQFDDMKFEFYTVLKEITSTVEPSVLYFFIKKISKVPSNLLKAVELELMSQIIYNQ